MPGQYIEHDQCLEVIYSFAMLCYMKVQIDNSKVIIDQLHDIVLIQLQFYYYLYENNFQNLIQKTQHSE